MYKYLLFDLDDTLLDFKTAEKTAISQVLEKHGVEPTEKTVKLYSAINESCWKEFEKGLILRQEIYEKRIRLLAEELNVKLDIQKVTEDYFYALSNQGQLMPKAEELLENLSRKGYILAAVTNGTAIIQKSRILFSGIKKFFENRIYISEEIGLKKPQKEYFEYVMKQLGIIDKSQVLIIGDSPSSDILGAMNVNIDSCFVAFKGQVLPKDIYSKFRVENLEEIIDILKN